MAAELAEAGLPMIDFDQQLNDGVLFRAPGRPGAYPIVLVGNLSFGTAGNDVLLGGPGDDYLSDWDGDDLLYGGSGNDVLIPFYDIIPGRETLLGGAGDDLIAGSDGYDTLVGGPGDDTLLGIWINYGWGSSVLWGGAGDDILDVTYQTGIDYLNGRFSLVISRQDHFVEQRREYTDELHGGLGNDTLEASYGADRLYGDAGDDRIRGQDGDDLIEGGSGHDTIAGGNGADRVDGGGGNDVIWLGAGNDLAVHTGDFGRGEDFIFGEAGRDRIYGGRGGDRIDGGAGDDVLVGEAGADALTGGAGADVFVMRSAYGVDTITDFAGEDRLHLTQGINGLGELTTADVTGRLSNGALGAWLDLGNGNGVVFVGLDALAVSEVLQTGLDFV